MTDDKVLTALTSALIGIQQSLDRIAAAVGEKQALGFTDSVQTLFVFCNRSQNGVWYYLDGNSQPVNIPHNTLLCIVEKLEFKQVERRGKETWKTWLHVKADRPMVLEMGYDTTASKGLISSLASMSNERLKQPIAIELTAADADEVVFCNIYSQGEKIYAPYDETADWRSLSKQAMQNIELAKQ